MKKNLVKKVNPVRDSKHQEGLKGGKISNGADGAELEAGIKELSGISQKREEELQELDRIAKLLVRRDLELTETKEEQVKELKEMDRIAKMLVRRDLKLSEIREKREEEFKKLESKTKELEDSRRALMNILEDVEAAKRTAEEEEKKTLAIITNFTDGLLVFDNKNKLSLINPRAEDFFKVKSKEVVGKNLTQLTRFSLLKLLISILLGHKEIKGIYRKEIPLKENLILEVNTIPIMREEEKLGTLVVARNITREKMIERMKSEFVSITAHQLRTPLSAIKWSIRTLLSEDPGNLREEQKDFLRKTYQSNERMIVLINDLLNVARIEEGRYLYRPVSASMEEMVQSVIASYKERIKEKKLDFVFRKPEKKLPMMMVDVEKIRLAIQNLLDNAVEYTLPGGKVTVSLKCANMNIEFSVKDTGVGIPKGQQERIFSKFFRGANVIRIETEGSGLGLFITKNIIEAHGGKIWFDSKENEGTVFYFTLPIKKKSTTL